MEAPTRTPNPSVASISDSLSTDPEHKSALESSSGLTHSSADDTDTGSIAASSSSNEKQLVSYSPPPEGGYGWVVVVCSFLLEFFAEGPLSAFGVFQEYYVNDRFKGRVSNATISLVGVLSGSSMAILGVVSGKLCERYGYRIVPLCGVATLSLGYFLASFATQPWHLLLTQGVLCGIGAAMTFMPAVVVPSQWFERRRGLASGIVNMGIGVGGIAWTQFNHLLISRLSVTWTLRLTSVVVLVTCSVALLLIRTHQATPAAKRVDLQAMRNKSLVVYMTSAFFTGVSSLVPFYYLPGYVRDIGLSTGNGAAIASIANAASLAGRFIATSVSDYCGPAFILVCAYVLTTSSILFIWTTTHGYVGTMVFGIVFGIGYGATFTQTSAFVAKYFGVDTLPVFVGLYYTMSGLGYLLGPPIAGVILERTRSWGWPYTAVKLYTGIPMVVAFAAIIMVKVSVSRK
ncbi:MFS general substrate transporter [Martensiomyces pterosporus]|nr:MFS general substrate transporter [Martensiomyces pterosporus]